MILNMALITGGHGNQAHLTKPAVPDQLIPFYALNPDLIQYGLLKPPCRGDVEKQREVLSLLQAFHLGNGKGRELPEWSFTTQYKIMYMYSKFFDCSGPD